jgi:hypothetical protein
MGGGGKNGGSTTLDIGTYMQNADNLSYVKLPFDDRMDQISDRLPSPDSLKLLDRCL